MTSTPYYWQHETGDLPAVVQRYLHHEGMSMRDVLMMRAYLTQWIETPAWEDALHDDDTRLSLRLLRQRVRRLSSAREISDWLRGALDLGIDPL